MRISVFGLGYVGCVSAGCLAEDGHTVIGVDKNQLKVDLVNAGRSPIIEKDIEAIIAKAVAAGKLRATQDATEAVANSDVSFVCVGTPSNGNGSLDFKHIGRVCTEIGGALRHKEGYHVVAIRSTILPGIARRVALPALVAASGKEPGRDVGFCVNPEFLREGTAVDDFRHPPKTVIGEYDERSGEPLVALYQHLPAPLFRVDIDTASMVKYADNAFHAVKIAFANEIGRLCKRLGLDSRQVMAIFVQDTKLNISPYYLRPGFAFGGSCLPKDLRAITYRAKELDVEVPLLGAAMESNRRHIEHAIDEIRRTGKRRIGFLGMSFKAGTDDLRESPLVTTIEYLIGKGYDVAIFDRNVSLATLVGSNKEYIEREIPHIARLLRSSPEEVVAESEVIVVGNESEEHRRALRSADASHTVIDLAGLVVNGELKDCSYEGICW
ncbi:MAG: nucleotide sugar dehydrogenase [bacterium]|jgi:GDP-mannose 6-dehydrogenase|nr:nucleotide sugar dehydrogenase [candidate division KSB1 bacterium]MDH7558838.1 nucleotide sugar dehydrogenase [bacterium]